MYMQFSFLMKTTVPFEVKYSGLSPVPRFCAFTSPNVFQLVELPVIQSHSGENSSNGHSINNTE